MLEVGDVVGGRWRLTDRLGQGGFGQVYRAVDASEVGLGAAALKVLLPSTSLAEQEHFLGEVQTVAQMRHPNLVAYLDSGQHSPPDGRRRSYLVTELCDYTLADALNQRPGGRMAPAEVAEVVTDLAAGLGYLQRRGLLHRDLKASNILYGADGWKLGDFGLTRFVTTTGHYHQTGEVIGSPHYMAPELFTATPASQASDMYALGVLVHEALTGRYPYEAPSTVALFAQISTQEPVIDPSLDPHWRWFITALMQRDPARRLTVEQLVPVLPKPAPAPAASPVARSMPAPPPVSRPAPPPVSQPVAWPHSQSPAVGGMAPANSYVVAQPPVAPQSGRNRLVLSGVLSLLVVGALAAVAWAVLLRPGPGETAADLPPEQRVAAVLPTEVDGPEGYQFRVLPPPPEPEQCVGVERPDATVADTAGEDVEFSDTASGHRLSVGVSVYVSADVAQEYLAAVEQAMSQCDGRQIWRSEAASVVHIGELNGVEVPGADEIRTRSWTFSGTLDEYPESFAINARIGDLVITSSGTDRETVEYYAQLATARALGQEEPAGVEPVGQTELVNG